MNRIETQRGNIIVLILVAVALFAGLTFTLSNSMQGGSSDELTDAQASQYASEILTYASQAEAVVAQMEFNGTAISDISTIPPGAGAFESGSDIHKIFHIDGGGLNYKPAKSPPFTSIGSWSMLSIDWEWTPTTASDLTLAAVNIEESVCAEINDQLTGDPTIPTMTALGDPITTTECAACEGYSSLCVFDVANSAWVFYSIIGPQ